MEVKHHVSVYGFLFIFFFFTSHKFEREEYFSQIYPYRLKKKKKKKKKKEKKK